VQSANHETLILLAEDNDDHYLLTQEAFETAGLPYRFYRVKDGEDLLDYLVGRGGYANRKIHPLPGLILLDLNMPKKDGRQSLSEIKAIDQIQNIPVLVFTTSKNEEDRNFAEKLGAVAFIPKPVRFQEFVDFMKMLPNYMDSF